MELNSPPFKGKPIALSCTLKHLEFNSRKTIFIFLQIKKCSIAYISVNIDLFNVSGREIRKMSTQYRKRFEATFQTKHPKDPHCTVFNYELYICE